MTFRHLASHTAGVIREPKLRGAASGRSELWTDKILESIPATAFDSIPGARYQYSNIGFGMLGLALERAAGRPFMDMVEEEIFTPLGMTGSTFRVGAAGLQDRLPVGYANGRDGRINTEAPENEHEGRGYKIPNSGIYSTVADLARFAQMLANKGELVKVLGGGELEGVKVDVTAHAFTGSAQEKITAVGGSATKLER